MTNPDVKDQQAVETAQEATKTPEQIEQEAQIEAAREVEKEVGDTESEINGLEKPGLLNLPARIQAKQFEAIDLKAEADAEWKKGSKEWNPVKYITRKIHSLGLNIKSQWTNLTSIPGAVIDTFSDKPQKVQSIF